VEAAELDHRVSDNAGSPEDDGARADSGPVETEQGLVERARLLLLAGAASDAVAVLEPRADEAVDASLPGLLGAALFVLERYALAAERFRQAAALAPARPEWVEQAALAAANAAAQVANAEPALPFERDALLAPPDVRLPQLAAAMPVPPLERVSRAAREAINGSLGSLARASLRLARAVAAVPRAPRAVWTSWYERSQPQALLELSAIREALDTHNLIDTYPAGELTAFQSKGLMPPPGVERFRTADGSWNNLANPKEGAAGVRIPRNVRRSATWPRQSALLEPNPAEISHVLLTRKPSGMLEVPFLNLLAASWIQFMLHDWVSHRIEAANVAHYSYELKLPADHPARVRFQQAHLRVTATLPDPTRSAAERGTPPTYISEVTSWWDASQIYGSDQVTADRLRSFRGGKLRLATNGRLPLGPYGIADVGFNRNWWVGLGMLHTLFVREHNAICDMLAASYPAWQDDQLYGVARLINAAVLAKIHSVEWTPAILPNPVLNLALNANWQGLLETLLHRRGQRKVLRAFKVREPVVGGLVGNARERFGVPYGLSEEFTEVYRLHELLPDEIAFRSIDGKQNHSIPLPATRDGTVHGWLEKRPIADWFHSFGNQHPGQLVLNNYPRSLQTLSVPGNPVYDLAAVDILRARERGVPRYNEFRRQLGLAAIRDFDDLTRDAEELAALRRVYGNDVEAIDLLVGTRAESQRPTGFGFGETMFQIFILNASRRLQADRFFTDCYTADYYTKQGLAWIDRASFKSVLLRHYPELSMSGLSRINNAFEPWDNSTDDLARHPLEAFA
jgi:hypothetical protein